MNSKYLAVAIGVIVVGLVCYWFVWLGNGEKPDEKKAAEIREKRRQAVMNLRQQSKSDEKAKQAVEEAFKRLIALDENQEHLPVAKEVARLAQKAPEVVVEKFLNDDPNVSYRALKVMYAFDKEAAETSGLVRLLVETYPQMSQGMQITILVALDHLRAKSALPLLKVVLDDRRNEPSAPRGFEQTPSRMCDTAYDAIAAILKHRKIEHEGLEIDTAYTSDADIELMKKWLDAHPELLKPPGTQEKKDTKK